MPKKRIATPAASLIIMAAIALVLVLVAAYLGSPKIRQYITAPAVADPYGNIGVHFINGQGDCMLWDVEAACWSTQGRAAPRTCLVTSIAGVAGFEYAVFTHPHEDHIGGADMILTDFTVSNVILPDCA